MPKCSQFCHCVAHVDLVTLRFYDEYQYARTVTRSSALCTPKVIAALGSTFSVSITTLFCTTFLVRILAFNFGRMRHKDLCCILRVEAIVQLLIVLGENMTQTKCYSLSCQPPVCRFPVLTEMSLGVLLDGVSSSRMFFLLPASNVMTEKSRV